MIPEKWDRGTERCELLHDRVRKIGSAAFKSNCAGLPVEDAGRSFGKSGRIAQRLHKLTGSEPFTEGIVTEATLEFTVGICGIGRELAGHQQASQPLKCLGRSRRLVAAGQSQEQAFSLENL